MPVWVSLICSLSLHTLSFPDMKKGKRPDMFQTLSQLTKEPVLNRKQNSGVTGELDLQTADIVSL